MFENCFIGELEVRFQEYPETYISNYFLSEIERSKEPIEIFEALNKRAAWMGMQN